MDKGFVFVSINYRLMPGVDMGTLIRDVAKAFRWTEDHIAEYGGDPMRVLAGAAAPMFSNKWPGWPDSLALRKMQNVMPLRSTNPNDSTKRP
jgi:hypothetical protein